MKRVVVDCDGAIVPQVASVPEPPIRRSLNHRGQSANVNLQILIPATALLAGIDGRSGDLVRIASYVYAADQSVSRVVKPTYMGMAGGGISLFISQ